ncbi:MAG: DUF2807 domain-containing protein [Aquincola sp.]|nr:DUF2807 domain-containing protein [Aquincola sp.]|tara:strand:- start:1176 stop:1898 length:723 start_codon:yes stop_codon:yes gene_type:complete
MPESDSSTLRHPAAALAAGLWMAVLAAVATPAGAEPQHRYLGGFDRVELNTAAKVVIRRGDADAIVVDATPAQLPLIGTQVENDTLKVVDQPGIEGPPAQVLITLRQLRALAASGVTQVTTDGLAARELSITGGGASALTLRQLHVSRLRVALGGGSQLLLTGRTRELNAQLGGQAGLDAADFDVEEAMVQGGGRSHATVSVRQSLNVAIAGASVVSYYGSVQPTVAIGAQATLRALGKR